MLYIFYMFIYVIYIYLCVYICYYIDMLHYIHIHTCNTLRYKNSCITYKYIKFIYTHILIHIYLHMCLQNYM